MPEGTSGVEETEYHRSWKRQLCSQNSITKAWLLILGMTKCSASVLITVPKEEQRSIGTFSPPEKSNASQIFASGRNSPDRSMYLSKSSNTKKIANRIFKENEEIKAYQVFLHHNIQLEQYSLNIWNKYE